MAKFLPFLNVYIIWHPDADNKCLQLAEALYNCLNRNPDQPFAYGIGIPVYFRSLPQSLESVPKVINLEDALHTVVFVLVEDNLVVAIQGWKDYFGDLYAQNLTDTNRHLFVPVALSQSACNLHPSIAETNFVRLYDLPTEAIKPKLIHYAAHILSRLLDNNQMAAETGIKLSPLPIKLFISHTKREPKALQLAESLKQELDNTQVARFFDKVDIASGHNFADEIEGSIKNSAVIAIRSDRYSESPWCRMEVITAKRLNRPMIVVDALQYQEHRSFPYLSNIPSIRYDLANESSEIENRKGLQAIIDFALLEVLRFIYLKKKFNYLKLHQHLPQDAQFLSRPPEERDLKNNTSKLVVYPDPPLGYEENSELSEYRIPLATPTTYRGKSLKGMNIGISISEPDANELAMLGLSNAHLQSAMIEIARYCLAQGATLVYGGDLRPGGFTENLLELVRYHNDALHKDFEPVVNFLAWPLVPTLDIAWQARNSDALAINKVDAPDDLKQAGLLPDINQTRDINTIPAYVWARCLTAMREKTVHLTDARIMLGGRTTGYKGKYPGLIEEALLTLEAQKPLFLLGGFGGATLAIIQALQSIQPEKLSEAYQCANIDYEELIEEFNQKIKDQILAISPVDYAEINQKFSSYGISGLNNGLTDVENETLFYTVNIEEAIGLILKGLENL